MILADTSIWVEHFRSGLPGFSAALTAGRISMHAVVLGELATGNLSKRETTLAGLRSLPPAVTGSVDECLGFIEAHALFGKGIGWNDVQLLVAARLSGHALWSLDKRLATAAMELGIAAPLA